MSSSKIDGDDVFRISCSVEEIAQKTAYLTDRDHFAAKAMQGLLANSSLNLADPAEMAVLCYNVAEAMIAERNKRG